MTEEQEDTLLNSVIEATTESKEETKPEVTEETETTEEKTDDAVEDESKDKTEEETAEDAVEPSEEVEPSAKPTKRSASDTIRALKAERNAERLEREKLVAEAATAKAQLEFIRQQQQSVQTEAQRKAEEERLALLDPTERAVYQANQKAQALEHRLNIMQMQMQDRIDRAEFQAKAQHDPLVAKYKDQVEEMYQDGLKRGVAAPREELLNLIVGREIRKESAQNLSKKKESASKRIDAVTGKPASARGDVAGSKKGKSEEDRLRGVLI